MPYNNINISHAPFEVSFFGRHFIFKSTHTTFSIFAFFLSFKQIPHTTNDDTIFLVWYDYIFVRCAFGSRSILSQEFHDCGRDFFIFMYIYFQIFQSEKQKKNIRNEVNKVFFCLFLLLHSVCTDYVCLLFHAGSVWHNITHFLFVHVVCWITLNFHAWFFPFFLVRNELVWMRFPSLNFKYLIFT